MEKIRVLIVDDSAFVRAFIRQTLDKDPRIEVVGVARDGEDAIQKAAQLQPDVVTLDVEMPRKSGLEALPEILQVSKAAVIMVSSLTQEGAEATIEALEKGAADFIPKPASLIGSGTVDEFRKTLVEKIHVVGTHKERFQRVRPFRRPARIGDYKAIPVKPKPSRGRRKHHPKVVIIGISTGGPLSLQQVIPMLPGDFPLPVVVVQHMPPQFTKSLADRLNTLSQVTVKEAAEGDELRPATVYIAPGGRQMLLRPNRGHTATVAVVDHVESEKREIFKPSVNVTTFSALKVFGGAIIGVMMTGMGSDGKEAFIELHRQGGIVIAQDERTCVVYGMPRAVVEAGIADYVLPLEKIAETLVDLVSQPAN